MVCFPIKKITWYFPFGVMGAFRVGEKAPSFYFIKIQKRRNSHGVRKFVAQSQTVRRILIILCSKLSTSPSGFGQTVWLTAGEQKGMNKEFVKIKRLKQRIKYKLLCERVEFHRQHFATKEMRFREQVWLQHAICN